jgi:hypothetical protein
LSIIEVAEIVGILSFSLSGFFIAASSKLDILGVLIASFLTALGGGVIRDVLAQRELYAFTNNLASILVISVVFIAIVLKLQRFKELEKSTSFMVVDSLGLVSFAISGALVGVEAEFNFFGVILLSLITAVGGGVIIAVVAFTAAGADVAETHKVVSSQYISEAVCLTESLRGEDGHTTGTKVASEYRQVQLVCADLFRLTAPFLLAVNACHNGQPWLKGEQQTSWLTGHLLISCCLVLCNCLKSNILS